MDQDKINNGELYEQFHKLHSEYGHLWLNETFLHWDWWVCFLLGIGPWIFWIYYRKKESTHRLLYVGMYAVLISLCLDYIGVALGLWYYVGKLTPTFPAWVPFNFAIFPVAIMFLIQTKPHIPAWKKGLLFALLTSFIGEPLVVWAGFYVLTGWQYIYSAPIYFLLYLFFDYISKRVTFEPMDEKG